MPDEVALPSALNDIVPDALIGERLNVVPAQTLLSAAMVVVVRHTSWIFQSPTRSPPQAVTARQVVPLPLAPATFPAPPEPEPENPFEPALLPVWPAPGFAPPTPELEDEPPQPVASAAHKNTAVEPNVK
jgi:hypothetical protein